ncbi:EAL domain-containing protein [Rickettsiales endosymbiont of Stachyamoeba lipophora]|nr:EAL domain-containing protein [Rickettsiales endosymbiont of Stachyamoeba lipophora]
MSAIYCNFSKLSRAYQSNMQLKIALKTIADILVHYQGYTFQLKNNDIVIIMETALEKTIEQVIFQLRYLFIDDPLAYINRGVENKDFCKIYFLTFEFKKFVSDVEHSISLDHPAGITKTTISRSFGEFITVLEHSLKSINIAELLKRQIIAISTDGINYKAFCEEIFVNIPKLKQILPEDVLNFPDRLYNDFLFDLLDQTVIYHITSNLNTFYQKAISINLNVSSVLTDSFSNFIEKLTAEQKKMTVVEINISEMFNDIRAFFSARELLQQHGIKLCLDGVNSLTLKQIDRSSLGFDLLKLQWNADLAENIHSEENQQLKQKILACGTNRIILCRCDDIKAINYGRAMGIQIFQGWHLDGLDIK